MTGIWIGTSGWAYDGWRGPFYPDGVAKKEWLKRYSAAFATTEINGSFYRTPTLDAVRGWRDQTPEDFLFSWKASKFITHWKRLSEKCANSLELMETRLNALEPKVACVLFQLPPQFEKNEDRLAAFLRMLSPQHRYAFEFRHKSWYQDAIFELLRQHDVALGISDHHDAPAPWLATARHVYVRGHGPGGGYRGNYSARTLRKWADQIVAWRRQRRDVLVYFDNDQKAAAPADAMRLADILGGAARSRERVGSTLDERGRLQTIEAPTRDAPTHMK